VTAVAAALVIAGGAAPAWAGKQAVVIGGDDAAVVAAVAKALRSRVERVDENERDRAAAVVTVTVTPTGKAARKAKRLTATVVVTEAADGSELGRMVVKERKARLAKAVGKVAWKKLGKAIGKATPRPAEPPPAVAATPPSASGAPSPSPSPSAPLVLNEERASASVRPEPGPEGAESKGVATRTSATVDISRRGHPRFAVTVDERPFWRRLRWNDDLDQVLRTYDLAANAVGVTFTARPFRAVPGMFVGAAGELAVGVNGSRTSDGMTYSTSASELSASLGWSVAIGSLELAAAAGYGEHRFSIDDDGMGSELLPDVTYRWLRGGLDARIPLDRRFAIVGRGGWRYLLDTGELADAAWFPRVTGNGLDASLGVQLRVTGWLGAYARAELRHYFFAMNPEIGDTVIAGGAVDSYIGGSLGFAVAIP
jgi:hypothetical protein